MENKTTNRDVRDNFLGFFKRASGETASPPPSRYIGDSFLLGRREAVLGSGLSPIREARIEANNLSGGSLEE